MKKIKYALILVCSFCLFTFSSYAAVDSGQTQSAALDKYQEIASQFNISRSADQYPDYYGGSYINSDNKLVVYVTGEIENVPSFLSDDESIILEHAEYSYNELYNFCHTLSEQVWGDQKKSLPFEVYSIYLADAENMVVVEMSDDSAENVQLFRNEISDSPMLRFTKGIPISNLDEETPPPPATARVHNSFNLGVAIEINNSGGASIGFRCKRDGSNGFMTKSHGTVKDGSTVSEGNNTLNSIGTTVISKFSGSVDATFVSLDNMKSITTSIGTTGRTMVSNHWVTSMSGTSTLYSYGRTSGSGSGVIESTAAFYTVNGVTITDCYQFKCAAANGDSGGIVYAYINGDYVPAGIVNAGNQKTTYASKITNIIDALGVEPY